MCSSLGVLMCGAVALWCGWYVAVQGWCSEVWVLLYGLSALQCGRWVVWGSYAVVWVCCCEARVL